MRASWIVGFVAASLGLSACGATATIHSAVASLGSSPDVQIHLTGTATGPGTAEAQQALGVVSIDMNFSNPSGAALSQAGTAVNSEVIVNVGAETLADLREVSGDDYLMINPSALTGIPQVTLPTSEVNAIQLLVGGRWFELQKGFIDSYLPTTSASTAQTAKEQAAGESIVDAISKLIDTSSYTTLPNGGGFSETGSLENALTTLLPTIESLEGTTTFTPPNLHGNYTMTLTMSGGSATGGSISITAPNGTQGNVTVGLKAAVTHNGSSVVAPVGATIVTKALLKELISQAS